MRADKVIKLGNSFISIGAITKTSIDIILGIRVIRGMSSKMAIKANLISIESLVNEIRKELKKNNVGKEKNGAIEFLKPEDPNYGKFKKMYDKINEGEINESKNS